MSISSAIPGLSQGKPSGTVCPQLSSDFRCLVFEKVERPACCAGLQANSEMCGDTREEALQYLYWLEKETAPEVQVINQEFRNEPDSMGSVQVPLWAYWGAQTQRAIDNFQISGIPMPSLFIHSLGIVKTCAITANAALGLLGTAGDPPIVAALLQAGREVGEGKWDRPFPVDVFQTGSGTSTNMNANEVIANRANEILGYPLGSRQPVHPNDHVNRCQSSNDIIPAVVQLSTRLALADLEPVLHHLASTLQAKAQEFSTVIK